MNSQIDKHILDKVNDEHRAVVSSSKEAINHAIEAGRLLSDIKAMCEHGEFLAIVNSKFEFSDDTALRYMKVYAYSTKTAELRNLQEAYKLIEAEEAKKKLLERNETAQRLEYRDKTGEKPANWQRSDDYAWSKLQDERQARQERIDDFKQRQEEIKADRQAETDNLNRSADMLKDYMKQQSEKAINIQNMNITNQNGGILQLLDGYLSSLSTDSQRIEECHNIIKYCRHKSQELQAS